MTRRAAIVTLYDNINIGNKLQNYAVQELLLEHFDEVDTLRYSEAMGLGGIIGWKGRALAKLGFPRKAAEKKRAIIRRFKAFEEFSERNISCAHPKSFEGYLTDGEIGYDAYICGSDQVWHNWNKSHKELSFFFLEFVPQDKRICLAPSFGFDRIPADFEEHYHTGIDGFANISCREESGCRMISDLVGREAALLVDPTLMLTTEQWDKIANVPQYYVPDRYLLVYVLGDTSKDINEEIRRTAQERGLKVIDIFNLLYPEYYATTPDCFLFLVKHAELVYTNSFHGAAFSLLYGVEARLFQRLDPVGMQMSNRLSTLSTLFGSEDSEVLCRAEDFEVRLERERDKFRKYLLTCIHNAG